MPSLALLFSLSFHSLQFYFYFSFFILFSFYLFTFAKKHKRSKTAVEKNDLTIVV